MKICIQGHVINEGSELCQVCNQPEKREEIKEEAILGEKAIAPGSNGYEPIEVPVKVKKSKKK